MNYDHKTSYIDYEDAVAIDSTFDGELPDYVISAFLAANTKVRKKQSLIGAFVKLLFVLTVNAMVKFVIFVTILSAIIILARLIFRLIS